MPRPAFTKIYHGNGVPGKRGAASHIGFYETFSSEIQSMYKDKFSDQHEAAAELVGCVLFLETSNRSQKITQADIREHKLTVLEYLDNDDLEAAKLYLRELYADEPALFNYAAIELLFDGEAPTKDRKRLRPQEKRTFRT